MSQIATALLGALLTICAAATSEAAPIASADGSGRVVVPVGDLDLRSNHDQHRLADRLEYAAYLACPTEAPATPSPMVADPRCEQAALAAAKDQMRRAIEHASGPTMAAVGGKSKAICGPSTIRKCQTRIAFKSAD